MNSTNEWYFDGTFDVSPELFKQVVTINIIFRGKNLPLVYALIPNKAEKSYKAFFTMLLTNDEVALREPVRILIDFEKAIINAINATMPNTIVSGCYFHLTQSLWRNVQTKGLVSLYDQEKSVRLVIRRLMALPFVPKNQTIKVFQLISNSSPEELKDYLNYFETYYIGNLKVGSKSCRLVPCFPIDLWNVYKVVLSDQPRSNNSLESWHKQFAADVNSHPDVNKLINKFREEQKSMEFMLKQLQAGDSYSRKKSEVAKDDQLKKVLISFDLNKAFNYLDQIIDILRNSK